MLGCALLAVALGGFTHGWGWVLLSVLAYLCALAVLLVADERTPRRIWRGQRLRRRAVRRRPQTRWPGSHSWDRVLYAGFCGRLKVALWRELLGPVAFGRHNPAPPARPVLDFLDATRFSPAFYLAVERWARAAGDEPLADEVFLMRRGRETRPAS